MNQFIYVQLLLKNVLLLSLLLCFSTTTLLAQSLWSDPATWGGTKPVAGDDVIVPMGTTILLDETPPDLGALTIMGTLEFDNQNLNLTADYIMVMGTLQIGSETTPFAHQATITLKATDRNQSIMNMGTRGIMVMGGNLELHGVPPAVPWTKIDAHAQLNSTNLTLTEPVNWSSNDEVVIAPTDFFEANNGASVAQRISLTQATGTQLTLSTGVNAHRWGLLQYATNNGISLSPMNLVTTPSDSTPTVLDERAPVGNLSRNIVIQAPNDAMWTNQGFGCHIMIMRDGSGTIGTAHLNGVEIRRGGQDSLLGRYPFHWHMLSYNGGQTLSDATGQYIKNSVINSSRNRGIVIHGTNGVRVDTNIVYDVRGHGVFTEDASERRNIIDGNLVLHVRNPTNALKVHEGFGGRGSSGFWISNPDNTVINNTAADCYANGFWLPFPEETFGLSSGVMNNGVLMNPSRLRFGVFDNNTAHSNRREGIMLDNVEIDSLGNTYPYSYRSTTDGQDPSWPFSTLRRFELTRYKVWKNGSNGIWDRAVWPTNTGVVSADNGGRFFAGSGTDGLIHKSLVVGTSLNHLMNGTDRPPVYDFNGDETPVAFATYHSAFDIRDNVILEFPMTPNIRSGAFSTEDYYIRPVEKGQIRNSNNLMINTHPGVRLPSTFPYFALSGAIWDPHQTWGGPTPDYFYVYDSSFFTYGQTPIAVAGGAGAGGVLVEGPFYGFNDFVVNLANIRWRDFMQIEVDRLDEGFNVVGEWNVLEAQPNWGFDHMRHFAAHYNGYYQLDFPTIDTVYDVGISVENMLLSEDTLVVAIEYNGGFDVGQVYTSSWFHYLDSAHTIAPSFSYKHVYSPVSSRQEVINSVGGQTYWQDKQNNLVWIKVQGGIQQTWNDSDYNSTDDELLYRRFYLRVWGTPDSSVATEREIPYLPRIDVFPNPTQGSVNVVLGETASKVTVRIADAMGRVVKQEIFNNTNQLELNMANLVSGMYFLMVETETYRRVLKVVKE